MTTLHGRRAARSIAAIALAALLVPAAWLAGPPPATVQATGTPTAASVELTLLTWLNRDRVALGLRPLRRDVVVAELARERATRLAGAGILGHQYAGGDLGSTLEARGVAWYRYGENIGTSTAAWGLPASNMIYALWRSSAEHWASMTSDVFNYVGIGVARSSATGATYASLVLIESSDHTAPWARMTSARAVSGATGTAAAFTWRGADPILQSHTAGLRTFDVQYRVDAGAWRIIRSATTATALTLPRRPPGHSYWLRVRARDGRGNLSAWSRPLRVVVR